MTTGNTLLKDTNEQICSITYINPHSKAKEQMLNGHCFLIAEKVDTYKKKPVQFFVKRMLDKFLTFLGIIILSPVFLTIATLIKLDSRGPVLFKQERLGYKGKKFYMYKFRSMQINAEDQKGLLIKHNQTNKKMFKMHDDPRVTRVGKFLRKYSLDEFPQLINVLKGEMSLVGFRPPLMSEVLEYEERHFVRFSIEPGLTGPWQVGGRSKIKSFDKVIDLEYNYIKNWNLLKDFLILIKTVPVVLLGDDFA